MRLWNRSRNFALEPHEGPRPPLAPLRDPLGHNDTDMVIITFQGASLLVISNDLWIMVPEKRVDLKHV